MADTVKLPGVGDVKKQYVYVGAALVAGIVGYAWWSRRGDSSAAPTWDVDSVPSTSYISPGSGSTYNAPMPEGMSTNTEWAREAMSWGLDRGYDDVMVGMAIAQYLAKRPVNAKEEEFLKIMLPQIGPPPNGGPYSILADTSAPTGGELPDLTRPGWNNQIPGAPWKYTIARSGETWLDIASRVYDWPKNGAYHDPPAIEAALRGINTQIKTTQPKAGDIIGYR